MKNGKSINRCNIPQQYADREKKIKKISKDYEFQERVKFIINNKITELKESLRSELNLCCKNHNIKRKTIEHFILSDELHNRLRSELNPHKLDEEIFVDLADELGYTYHIGNEIYSYIEHENGFPMPESILLK